MHDIRHIGQNMFSMQIYVSAMHRTTGPPRMSTVFSLPFMIIIHYQHLKILFKISFVGFFFVVFFLFFFSILFNTFVVLDSLEVIRNLSAKSTITTHQIWRFSCPYNHKNLAFQKSTLKPHTSRIKRVMDVF